jgi:hypothetical protein
MRSYGANVGEYKWEEMTSRKYRGYGSGNEIVTTNVKILK